MAVNKEIKVTMILDDRMSKELKKAVSRLATIEGQLGALKDKALPKAMDTAGKKIKGFAGNTALLTEQLEGAALSTAGMVGSTAQLKMQLQKTIPFWTRMRASVQGFQMEFLGMGFFFMMIGNMLMGFTKQALSSLAKVGSAASEASRMYIQFQGALKSFYRTMGESEAIQSLLKLIVRLVDWFEDLDYNTQQLIFSLIVFGGIIAMTLSILGFFILGLSSILGILFKLSTFLKSGAIIALGDFGIALSALALPIAILIAAILIFAFLWENKLLGVDKIVETAAKNITASFDKMLEGLRQVSDGLNDFFEGLFTGDTKKVTVGAANVMAGLVKIVWSGALLIASIMIQTYLIMVSGVSHAITTLAKMIAEADKERFVNQQKMNEALLDNSYDWGLAFVKIFASVFLTIIEIIEGIVAAIAEDYKLDFGWVIAPLMNLKEVLLGVADAADLQNIALIDAAKIRGRTQGAKELARLQAKIDDYDRQFETLSRFSDIAIDITPMLNKDMRAIDAFFGIVPTVSSKIPDKILDYYNLDQFDTAKLPTDTPEILIQQRMIMDSLISNSDSLDNNTQAILTNSMMLSDFDFSDIDLTAFGQGIVGAGYVAPQPTNNIYIDNQIVIEGALNAEEVAAMLASAEDAYYEKLLDLFNQQGGA